jgi:ATP-dependent DNA ligase
MAPLKKARRGRAATPLPIRPPFAPMEATLVDKVPIGPEWQYEPKWDGFRCLLFRDGNQVELQSKAERSLSRYFPEITAAAHKLKTERFVLDGELVVLIGQNASFDDLLQRIHPAVSRIALLARTTPAIFIAFDLLVDAQGHLLVERALSGRRRALEAFANRYFKGADLFRLSPATSDLKEARRWLTRTGGALDGIIAKRNDLPYRARLRDGMQKIKNQSTVDCVVGGFRYNEGKPVVGSLLLGLYDDEGKLNHVGFTSSLAAREKPALTAKLRRLIEPPGFTGAAPGGPSRWSTERSAAWEPLKPELVVEVSYDHFSGGRFRHGTKLLRWRPDKSPRQCTLDQVSRKGAKLGSILRT